MGDLHERYQLRAKRVGEAKAKRIYFREVLAYVRPSIFKRKKLYHQALYIDMISNYLLIAYRNLAKHKAFTLINITGLTVGIACCLLLFLYIKVETAYDRHHAQANHLYRITTAFQNADGMAEHLSTSSPPIAMSLINEFPEVVNATRLVSPPGVDQHLIQYGENSFFESKGLIADSTFFEMFDYEFIAGNPKRALSKPNAVVLTQPLAEKIFHKHDVLGEIIRIDHVDYQITGVLRETNHKCHIEAHFFTSMESEGLGKFVANNNQWAGQNFVFSYIQLNPESSPEALEAKFPAFLNNYGAENLRELGMSKSLHLQAVTDIHLHSHSDHELGQNGNIVYIYVLSAIAGFILLIACINFMNLATAKASQRASEVGVRKTLGASQWLLIRQFLSESMLIVLIAVGLSWLLVEALLPYFNHLTGKEIEFSFTYWPYYSLAGTAITVVTGLLAGAYPAFFLSSFQPAKVLKGKVSIHLSTGMLRKGLVVFQFVIAICLISGVIIILSQLDYMRQQDLGFNPKSRVVIPLRTNRAAEQYQVLKNKFSQHAEIQKISASSMLPGRDILNDFRLYPAGSNMENGIYAQRYFVDDQLLDVLDMDLIQGRNFKASPSGSQRMQILINQQAIYTLGIAQHEAIGKKLYTDYDGTTYEYEVIGVINDFHQLSLHQPIVSTVFHPGDSSDFNFLLASVHPEHMKQALSMIEEGWKETIPEMPFEYSLLDQQIQQQYESDTKMFQIIGSFTLIAILISCLGLYGLSAFVAERRVKEIGIRKVMGAQVNSIIRLLSRDFTKLVLIAFIISVPLSYVIMDQWLQVFAFRIELTPVFFIIAGLTALLLAWVTVGYHSIRAALANPVDSLRNE